MRRAALRATTGTLCLGMTLLTAAPTVGRAQIGLQDVDGPVALQAVDTSVGALPRRWSSSLPARHPVPSPLEPTGSGDRTDLDTFAGGLRPLERAGDRRSRSLHLQGADERAYLLRPADPYAGVRLPSELEGTLMLPALAGSGPAPHLVRFGPGRLPVAGLIWYSRDLDRELLTGLEWVTWDSVVRAVQARLGDVVIDSAAAGDEARRRLAATLRNRRDRLSDAARRFYLNLAAEADLHATDAAERITVTGTPHGAVRVELAGPGRMRATSRQFEPSETREVRIFAHGGADTVVAGGERAKVRVRVIGGEGDDAPGWTCATCRPTRAVGCCWSWAARSCHAGGTTGRRSRARTRRSRATSARRGGGVPCSTSARAPAASGAATPGSRPHGWAGAARSEDTPPDGSWATPRCTGRRRSACRSAGPRSSCRERSACSVSRTSGGCFSRANRRASGTPGSAAASGSWLGGSKVASLAVARGAERTTLAVRVGAAF